jgi:hypothetical protein
MLAAYLQNPLAVDPSGRMPHMLLKGDEARDLARFLCTGTDKTVTRSLPSAPKQEKMLAVFKQVDNRPEELKVFQRQPVPAQWLDLGKRLVIDKGCNNCHTVAPGGKNFAAILASATFDEIKSAKVQKDGCLANKRGQAGKAPWFGLGEADRDALRAFLREGMRGTGAPAPAYAGRVAIERFNCLACHTRNGEGGLPAKLTEELRRFEKAENAEAVVPPPLTDVGHKLRTPWIKEVMVRAGRARPWMGLRMPQFGEANIGKLPEALAALEGTDPEANDPRFAITSARIAAGRRLVGKQAFGCITCHDLAGIPNTGTRGPDLALMNQRVRYGWYRRWLQQSQQMQPGTRMPTVFPEGKSLVDDILGGRADGQAEAIWAYLALGPLLPLPEGMEPANQNAFVLTVKDQPVILRSFMPDAGSKAIAVGYPGGVSTVFDARTCRLAYAWTGRFLDASPVWDNRGGAPAKVLGPRVWNAPPGCPWAVNDSNEPPDFAAHARDPAYGGRMPEGKLFEGKRRLAFKGYALDKEDKPTFHYRIDAQGGFALDVKEQPEPLRSPAGIGLARRFTLTLPRLGKSWFLAGDAAQEPRQLNEKGAAISLDLKTGHAELPAAGRLLVLPQGGGKVILLHLTAGPERTHWRLQRQGGRWQALVALPAAKEAFKAKVDLRIWSPYRDHAALIKELATAK